MKGTEVTLGPFSGGVNNVAAETELPGTSVREGLNTDFTESGFRRRGGYTKLRDLVDPHSLWSDGIQALLVNDGWLCAFIGDEQPLVQLVQVRGEVSYASIMGATYWSDGEKIGRISSLNEALDVWVPTPPGQPTVAATASGAFQPGTYQVAITYMDATGMESGADQAAIVELTSVGGIHLSDIPQSDKAAAVAVYITAPNGTELRRHVVISMGLTSIYINTPFLGVELETQFADQMPAADILCHHYGRLYGAVGNALVYSESLRQGLTRLTDNYFQFPATIKIVLSHASGLFVVADKTYFLPGSDPENMGIRAVYPFSGVKSTGDIQSASMFGIEAEGEVPYWFSDNGPVLGLTDGVIYPLTEENIAVPAYASGATLFREIDGIRSVLTTVKTPGYGSKFGASDSASFEVRRNGIIVPA